MYENSMYETLCKFMKNTSSLGGLYCTNSENLWEYYLSSFPEQARSHYNCNTCRNFVNNYGGLVAINNDGTLVPAMWPEGTKMYDTVKSSPVVGVFSCKSITLGIPHAGGFEHLCSVVNMCNVCLNPNEKREYAAQKFRMVMSTLAEISESSIATLVELCADGAFKRTEVLKDRAFWLQEIKALSLEKMTRFHKKNLLWKKISEAPDSFCHVKQSVLWSILEDIEERLPTQVIIRKANAKLSSDTYQRPIAAPTESQIDVAERLVAKLNLAPSFERRLCRLDEVHALWRKGRDAPKAPEPSVFGNLREPQPLTRSRRSDLEALPITWEKFHEEVLLRAKRIEIFTPQVSNYTVLVTAVHPDAPPLLKWDSKELRNPVSWYTWPKGMTPEHFGLKSNVFCEVLAVAYKPSMWNHQDRFDHLGFGVLFFLEGAKETTSPSPGLFPEFLLSDLHPIRRVIEAHNRTTNVIGLEYDNHAIGLMVGEPSVNHKVRVDGRVYIIDRRD